MQENNLIKISNLELLLTNLKPFQNLNYFECFFKDKPNDIYISNYNIILEDNNLPCFLLINFKDEQSKNNFVKFYSNKNYEKLNIPITFIDTHYCITNNYKDSNVVLFKHEYYKLSYLIYERTMKESGLVYKDKKVLEAQDKVISYLIKQFTKNLFNGESIMNISLPINIFDERTLLQVFAYEQSYAEIYLNRAFYSSDIERLKWVSVFLFSQMHLSCMLSKPFNPILGETFQCNISGLKIYIEHIYNKPPTYLFYCFSNNYKIYGHQIVEAKTGTNSVKAFKRGKYTIKFADNSEFEIEPPSVLISGITMGKRTFNYRKSALVIDKKNSLASMILINPEKSTGFKSVFFSSQKTFPDYFKGSIVNTKDIEFGKYNENEFKKKFNQLHSIEGEWTKELKFDNEIYWSLNDYNIPKIYNNRSNVLKSDSSNREDLKLILENKQDECQKSKEELEENQRKDRKLREKAKK